MGLDNPTAQTVFHTTFGQTLCCGIAVLLCCGIGSGLMGMRGGSVYATFSSHTMECESAGTARDPTSGKTVVSFLDVFPGFSP